MGKSEIIIAKPRTARLPIITFTPEGDTDLLGRNIRAIQTISTSSLNGYDKERLIGPRLDTIREILARSGSALDPELVQSAQSFLPPPSTK